MSLHVQNKVTTFQNKLAISTKFNQNIYLCVLLVQEQKEAARDKTVKAVLI